MPNITVKRCNVLNPDTLLPTEGDCLTTHNCVVTITKVCSSRPDLQKTPLQNPEFELFVDGSASGNSDMEANHTGDERALWNQKDQCPLQFHNTGSQRGFTNSQKCCQACLICATDNIGRGMQDHNFHILHLTNYLRIYRCEGKKHFLVIVYMFSKWLEVFPTCKQDTVVNI